MGRISKGFEPAELAPVTEQVTSPPSAMPSAEEYSPPPSPASDYVIKNTLKQFKKLELQLSKFNSRKLNTLSGAQVKGNMLRTSLLPLLRHHRDMSSKFATNSTMYKSLVSVVVAVLIKWWQSLVANLMVEFRKPDSNSVAMVAIPASDRSAYLESISRIMALPYWEAVDEDFYENYQQQLIGTIHWSTTKLSTLKTVPISVAAFVGKVFAYSFFHVPHVSTALLFLLNVKQARFEHTSKLLGPSPTTLKTCFPTHLHYLIGFNGVPVTSHPIDKQAQCINCVPPPKQAVPGIKDPQGNWVRRWGNCDSPVFMSFFRHYMIIIEHKLQNINDTSALAQCPGFSVLFAHVVNTIHLSINRIASMGRSKQPPPANVTMALHQFSLSHSDVYYNSVIKLFKTIRDIVYCSVTGGTGAPVPVSGTGLADALVKYIDIAMGDFAQSVTVHDQQKSALVLNVAYEFICHIVNNIPMSASLINWEFWLSCCYQMLDKSDHFQTTLKTFAFLFNTWPQIPDALSRGESHGSQYGWLVDPTDSYKLNFVNWLISNQVFVRFMTHWSSIVRSFYLRLLVWRVIGVNNSQSSPSILTTKRLQDKINKSYNVIHDFAVLNSDAGLDFSGETPLVNRKVGILPMNAKEDYMLDEVAGPTMNALSSPIKPSSELRKTHPYEVLDEAIYTCSSLPSSSANSSDESIDAKPKGIVTSLGKWFKFMQPENRNRSLTGLDQIGNQNISDLRNKRNSVSLTSISTAYSSMKSRSSSPSIMSFSSTHTSFTDSPSSSNNSDEESITTLEIKAGHRKQKSMQTQPMEFARMPPDIVRPIYRFDIIIDSESMNEKYRIISELNQNKSPFTKKRHPSAGIAGFPNTPKIPLISMYFTPETTRFYLHDESDVDIDNFINANPEADRDTTMLLGEYSKYYQTKVGKRRDANILRLVNLGRSLNELNTIIHEFKSFLHTRVEIDQFNSDITADFNESAYFAKIIPFLPIDSSNEMKLLNAN